MALAGGQADTGCAISRPPVAPAQLQHTLLFVHGLGVRVSVVRLCVSVPAAVCPCQCPSRACLGLKICSIHSVAHTNDDWYVCIVHCRNRADGLRQRVREGRPDIAHSPTVCNTRERGRVEEAQEEK